MAPPFEITITAGAIEEPSNDDAMTERIILHYTIIADLFCNLSAPLRQGCSDHCAFGGIKV